MGRNEMVPPSPPRIETGKMNELNQPVKEILFAHQGHSHAIKASKIASILGYKDDRLIRLSIRELITEGYPIASSVRQPYGYFIVQDRVEADEYQKTLKNRLIEDALRLRDFKRGAGRILNKATQGILV